MNETGEPAQEIRTTEVCGERGLDALVTAGGTPALQLFSAFSAISAVKAFDLLPHHQHFPDIVAA